MPRRLPTDDSKQKGGDVPDVPDTVARRRESPHDDSKAKGHTPPIATVLPPPSINVETDEGHYKLDGEPYRRVTSAINGGIPKPALTNWAKKIVAETAVESIDFLGQLIEQSGEQGAIDWLKGSSYRQRDAAAAVGTSLHEIMEGHVLGETPSAELETQIADDENLRRMEAHGLDLLRTLDPVWDEIEALLINDSHGYAGRCDGIARIGHPFLVDRFQEPNPRLIVDWKTSKGVYDSHSLQLTAYRYAERMLERATGDVVDVDPSLYDGAVVFHVRPEGWRIVPVDTSPANFEAFLAALRVDGWDRNEAYESIGRRKADLLSGAAVF